MMGNTNGKIAGLEEVRENAQVAGSAKAANSPSRPTKETLKRQTWALALAAKGLRVLELRPGSKRPKEGLAWGLHATSDPDKIKAMFKANPAMNYGVCPGRDYVIIDLDVKPGISGIEALGTLEIDHGLIPETFTVRTRGGGLHLYLKVPEEVGNANKFPDGIDVRGVGGYVVGPGCEIDGAPNPHDGGTYAHESGDLNTIADCPEWMRGFLGRPPHKDTQRIAPLCDLDLKHNIEEAERFLARREPAMAGENGNDWTFETVAFLRDIGLSDSMALEVILGSNWNNQCDPPWAADELAELIEHVYRYAENRPGSKRAPISRLRRMADVIPLYPYQYHEWRVGQAAHGRAKADPDEGQGSNEAEDRPLLAVELARGEFPRAEHLWRDFILKEHPNSIDGDGGVGKTQVLIQIAVAVAAGNALFGHEVIQAPVLLVLCEDDYGEIKHRLEGACAAMGVELQDLPIEVWCRPGKDSALAIIEDDGAWKRGVFYELLEARLREIGPCFLGLDTISDVAIMDENKRLPVNTLAKQVLGGLCRKYGLTALVTRHPSKSSMTDGTYYSGSTAANAAFRNRLLLKAEEKGDGRTLMVAKSNYGLKGEVSLHHSGSVLRSLADLERRQMEQAEREAVFELLKDLRANGVAVVPSHGNGHKPKDLVPPLKEKYGLDLDAKAVLRHLHWLQSNKRIHFLASKPGKNGRQATYKIGPPPPAESEQQ